MIAAAPSKSEIFAALPPAWPGDLRPAIRAALAANPAKVIVLDDDPTGTQTVHGVPVLTEWSREALAAELRSPGPGFFILTNSRGFPVEEACRINREIGEHLAVEAAAADIRCILVSRSDSTLRGHFPDETDALDSAWRGDRKQTPILLVPYFEAGGRFTIGDIHYVAEGDRLIPVGETPFARDAAFGFRSSDLRDWVVEKSRGRVSAEEVRSLTLEDLREGGPEAAAEKLQLADGAVCIANATCQRDLDVVVLGALLAEARGAHLLYRTAASFVATRMGIESKPLLTGRELVSSTKAGGLILVGSYVPKTTEQLSALLTHDRVNSIELDVSALLSPRRDATIDDALARLSASLGEGRDTVVFTSRTLVTAHDAAQSLAIGGRVSDALVELLTRLEIQPRYLIAKGGITSSDLATRGLGVRRAMVLGQLLPGVPVWELGPETRFPGLPYIVFPGNVGGPDALVTALQSLS